MVHTSNIVCVLFCDAGCTPDVLYTGFVSGLVPFDKYYDTPENRIFCEGIVTNL